MAYQTGTVNSVVDLLDSFAAFAIAQGWALNRQVTAGSGRELCISKGTAYFNFRAYNNETMIVNGSSAASKYGILLNGSDAYAAGTAWDRQVGYPKRGASTNGDQGHALMPLIYGTGPYPAYHFFAPDAKTLYCELEFTSGTYVRFGCGSLDLFNPSAPGGGRFCYATAGQHTDSSTSTSSWLGASVDDGNYALEMVPFRAADYTSGGGLGGSMVRVAFDSFDNWAGSGRAVVTQYQPMVAQGGGCHDKVLRDYSPSPINGVGLMLPNVVALNVAAQYLSPIGVMPGVRYMDMTNYLPGEEFTLGGDVWKVFPWFRKGGLSVQRGIAYKKVP